MSFFILNKKQIRSSLFTERYKSHVTGTIRLLFQFNKRRLYKREISQNEKEKKEKKEKELELKNEAQMEKNVSYKNEKINIEVLNEELRNIEEKIKKTNITKKEKELKEKQNEVLDSHFKYPRQIYYKANEEEIELLKKSENQFYLPIECENSTIIRLINIKDKLTSPLSRCVRNSKIGLRKKERKFYILYCSFLCTFFFLMGIWQYKKVEKKKFLINYIIQNLNEPVLVIDEFDFPWYTDFVSLKEKTKILNEAFLKWQMKNDDMKKFSFTEHWNNFKERLFSKGFDIAWGIKEEKKRKQRNLEEDKNELKEQINTRVKISDFSCVSEWIERVRNENMFFKMIRKITKKKKSITDDDLKKVVIEKYKYRKVEVSGVLDTANEFYVGPKLRDNKKDHAYYYVICPLYLKNGKAILINRGLLPENVLNEKKEKQELPKMVTIRGILDPGELYESTFKKIKNFSNKNKYTNYFFYYEPIEICHYSNISNFLGASYFILNVYDIIYHEDLLYPTEQLSTNKKEDKEEIENMQNKLKRLQNINLEDIDRESKERIKKLLQHGNSLSGDYHKKNTMIYTTYNNSSSNCNVKPFRYEQHFIHKKKKDYLHFFSDDNTHFNYACQWFLFSFLFSTISIFKFIQFKRWAY